ncbi:hypothetical protein EOE18_06495 [Novosphingobium umbonatum]|uniref:Lipocalin-like domain-containing protein n=2 Tax=Novosphingobium umbonatum TaxID=1908524 RepID=A0A437N991_9SPHN|nr:hypothetical protein EOE18_06495 [Novosphingobium umbonatum]
MALALVSGVTAPAQATEPSATSAPASQAAVQARQNILGAWQIASLEQPGPDGQMQTTPCCGLLTLTEDGHMAVQVMLPESMINAYSHGGYEASYGTFKMSPDGKSMVFHVDGALVRDLVGRDLPRAIRLEGNRLIITSTNPAEHWRVVWQRP